MNRHLTWFIIALAAQGLILASVPARRIYARYTGKTVILKTAPVDPYDIMSGYYVTLNYEISNPPFSYERLEQGAPAYVVLKEGDDGFWNVVSVHESWPKSVPDDAVVIKGRHMYGRIIYGIESYFIPENARETVERDLRLNPKEAKVEAKVDSFGYAAPIKLLIQDRVYQY